jgi:hypothetical protein
MAAASQEEGMHMESTVSFERHLEEAIVEARKVDQEIKSMSRDLKKFEEEVKKDSEHAAAEEQQWEIEFDDLGELDEEEEDQTMIAHAQGASGVGALPRHPDDWRPEAILGRRCKDGGKRIFYKVKWKGINLVTWEPVESVEAWTLIEEFDRAWMKKAYQPTKKLRPVYVGQRRAKRAKAAGAPPGGDINMVRTRPGRWSCEVEPFIWIPYDDATNHTIENAYINGFGTARIQINGHYYTIEFKSLKQTRDGPPERSSQRRVQRTVQRSAAEERAITQNMSVEELRAYVAGIVEFTEFHYELLARLHEMDKVVVTAPKVALDNLKRRSFENILIDIADGAEFPGFSTECYICLEDYHPEAEVVVLRCGHFFDYKCICDYLKKYSSLCPVCKASVE